jgi:hypothetical protein
VVEGDDTASISVVGRRLKEEDGGPFVVSLGTIPYLPLQNFVISYMTSLIRGAYLCH